MCHPLRVYTEDNGGDGLLSGPDEEGDDGEDDDEDGDDKNDRFAIEEPLIMRLYWAAQQSSRSVSTTAPIRLPPWPWPAAAALKTPPPVS